MPQVGKTEFEHFMNQARTKLTGASDSGIKTELYEVVKEFLRDTNAWVERNDIEITANVNEYQLAPRDGGQIIRLVGVWDHNRVPVAAFMPSFGELIIHRAPNVTPPRPWLVVVVKNLVLPTTRDDIPIMPDWILNVYSLDILDGLLGKMMAQQQKSYTDSVMSTYHLRRFRAAIQMARTAAATQNTVGAQTWSFPRGWTSQTQRHGVSTMWPPGSGQ